MTILFVGKSPDIINFCNSDSHTCWEIIIPTSGSGILETENEKLPFSTNCVYAIPPNIRHSSYSETGFADIYIRFQTDSLKLKKDSITAIYNVEEIPFLANMLHGSYLKERPKIVESTLKLIIQIIYEHLKDSQNSPTANIRNYLIDNISNPDLSMKNLSQKFIYNSDYIRRIFKADFEVTPMEYLDNLRLSQAKEYLTNTPYKIEEISELCGFCDQFYFSRFFKKHTGISPSKFRGLNNDKRI